MSVLIKGIEMPKSCVDCPCFGHDSLDGKHAYQCNIMLKSYNWGLEGRPSGCPLVGVPGKHGRLIDADVLESLLENAINIAKAGAAVLKELGISDDPEIQMEIKAYTDILNGVREQSSVIEAEGEA